MIVGGLAEAAAGALAMGTGAFLASQAGNQLFANEIAGFEVPDLRRRRSCPYCSFQVAADSGPAGDVSVVNGERVA